MSANSSSLSEEPTSVPAAAAAAAATAEPQGAKRKRGVAGNPDPEAEVIALTAEELLATHRFKCEVCDKGFQREQNLQLHRRGHNLPWKLKKDRDSSYDPSRKKVYVCPEPTCVHHQPERALGDLTGIKKHFGRKHGEKKWKCERCAKFYAVESDFKQHVKTCGTREYVCECGTMFSRRDSFVTHRAFCEALVAETTRIILGNQEQAIPPPSPPPPPPAPFFNPQPIPSPYVMHFPCSSASQNPNPLSPFHVPNLQDPNNTLHNPSLYTFQNLSFPSPPPTGQQLLQESAIFSPTPYHEMADQMDLYHHDMGAFVMQNADGNPTRDFMGLNGSEENGQRINNQNEDAAQVSWNMEGQLNCTGGHMEPGNPSSGETSASAPTGGNGVVDDQFAAS